MHLTKYNCDCQCAIASVRYFQELQKATNHAFHLVAFEDRERCWGHCAVGFYDGGILYIADITFPQFDHDAPLVLIEPYSEYEKRLLVFSDHKRIIMKEAPTVKHFRQYTLRNWPDDQKPSCNYRN